MTSLCFRICGPEVSIYFLSRSPLAYRQHLTPTSVEVGQLITFGSSTTLTRHRRCLILSSLSGSVDHLVLTADHLATSSFFPPPISPTLTILSIYQAYATVDRTLIPPHRLVSSHDPP